MSVVQVKEKEFKAKMGLSSSQARLLHLTSRMHQMEYKGAKIEAEKLKLANDSDDAYSLYLEKLEQTKLVANVLSENGSMTAIDLTASVIFDYKKLPEQYSLETKDNKALIPADVSTNYRNTNSLSDFLKKYNLDTTYTQTVVHTEPNPTYENQEENYQKALDQWQKDYDAWKLGQYDFEARHREWVLKKNRYDSDYRDYQADLKQYQEVDKPDYETKHAEWEAKNPNNESIKNDTTQRWWVEEDYSLGEDFARAAKSGDSSGDGCYGSALSGGYGCYKHILAHIIEYNGTSWSTKSYTNSLGTGSSTLAGGGWCDNNDLGDGKNSNDVFRQVSEQLDMGIKPDADPNFDPSTLRNDFEKLISKYKTDGSVKTMKEWAIDLNYVASNNTMANYDASTFGSTLQVFQNSLEGSLLTFKREIHDEAVQIWRDEEPTLRPEPTWDQTLEPEPTNSDTPPEKPKREDYVTAPPTNSTTQTINHTTFKDKDKAQWYINLWYKMEGEDKTPRIIETLVHNDANNTDTYIYSCENKSKSTTTFTTNADWNVAENVNYMEIPANKMNDPQWLRNAIVEGYVVIQAFDPEESEFKDTSVSVTTRIDEVPDEKGLKKAEAEYEAALEQIDKKDRYYDKQLAALETERNATKEEMEALKNVAKDNVDRTFKLFS